MKLLAQWPRVEAEIGYSLRERFLMPVRSFDNAKAVAPFLLECDDRRHLLCVHVEKGNASALSFPPSITPAYYRPYFSFDPQEQPPDAVAPTLADAIERVAGGARRMVVDGALPLAVARQLEQRFALEPEPGATRPGTVSLRRVDPRQTSQDLAAWRPEAARVARKLVEQSPHAQRIGGYLEGAPDSRFASLDSALAQAKLDMAIVTSDLNMQEVGGVPLKSFPRPLAVLYRPGGDAWIMEAGIRADATTHASPLQALDSVGRGARMGVEGEDIGWGFASALQLGEVAYADAVLRSWRDHSTLPDLAFYIVTTRASLRAIDAALAFASDAVRLHWAATEMDAYAVYLRTLHTTVAATLPKLRVDRTLTNFHSGSRTIFPAMPAPYPLTRDSNTLKIDAGCLLFDPAGRLLGCSDIARTMAFSEAGQSLYEGFRDAVRHKLIPACRPGARGRDIHAVATDQVWGRNSDAMAKDPLYVKLEDPKAYARDVGHLLGKNNLAHLTFTSEAEGTLAEGMIACCEYQWPVANHAVAYEDTCLVTPEGGINLTCEEW
jgi:hypothetical protein